MIVLLQDFGPQQGLLGAEVLEQETLLGAEVLEQDYQGDFQATRSARNPATILQSDLLGFATPVTKMEILVTGPRH